MKSHLEIKPSARKGEIELPENRQFGSLLAISMKAPAVKKLR
jgi:hypothetical protein